MNHSPLIISYSPATGIEVGRFPDTTEATIHELVARAQSASIHWQSLGFKARKKILRAWAHYLANHLEELADVVALETGKPVSDAQLEVSVAIDQLSWAARNAGRFLHKSHRAPGRCACH